MAILEKDVWITLAGNVKYYENLGYEIPRRKDARSQMSVKRGTKILVKVEDLPEQCNIKVTKICDDCGGLCSKNQPYHIIINSRKTSDGKDRCRKCAKKLWKKSIPYERSLEFFAKENNMEYLINEFSNKNNCTPSKIFKGTADIYLWNCRKCGNEYDAKVVERTNGNNCPFCSGKRILVGFNDIWSTHPEVAKLFINLEDGYKYTYGSNARKDFRCENCNNIIRNRVISSIIHCGLSCPKCSDGISYPEKFLMNVLVQLNINFETQKLFTWSKNIKHENSKISGNKKYDFYIPEIDCIIETHGRQHYDDKNQFERNLDEEQENDKLKEKLSKENKINEYIIIDCRKSELEYIKHNILKSKLNELFDLNNIDWLKCHEFACNSLVKEVANLYNIGVKSTYKIAEMLRLDRSTVSKNYLKQAVELGWCNYDPKEAQRNNGSKSSKINKKKVIQLTLENEYMKEWESAREVYNTLNICYKKISSVCNGKMLSAGGFKWVFKSDYEDYKKTGKILFNDKRGKSKEVICLNTLEIFKSLTDAGRSINRAANNIKANIIGKSKSCGIHRETGEHLRWMYKEDYDIYIENENFKII